MTVVNFFVHIEPVPVDFGHILVDVNPISSRVRYASPMPRLEIVVAKYVMELSHYIEVESESRLIKT